MDIVSTFSNSELFAIALIFIWTGFVRSGLGFGGGALGLPLMLFAYNQPLFWLPVIGFHLLFFSSFTLGTRLHAVDWSYLKKSGVIIFPCVLIGVFGLIQLPTKWLLIFIYTITLLYAILWLTGKSIHSHNKWVDRILLCVGGYVAGTSLTGAPLIVAVFMRHVNAALLRNTLFVLWFLIVIIKMSTFVVVGIELNFWVACLLIPVAAIGHVLGLKAHDKILQNDELFKRIVGGVLIVISALGLYGV